MSELWDGPVGTGKTGAHLEVLKALNLLGRALELLREVEWGCGGHGGECYWCEHDWDTHAREHAPDCKLAKLLEEET